MRILPETLRNVLNQPVGKLLEESELVTFLKDESFIISIGDRVTYTLLHHNIFPSIAIVDYICERKTYDEDKKNIIQSFGKLVLRAKNPAGFLTDDLWDTIKQAITRINEGPIRIDVDGEEDMASLAVIYHAPVDATVIYGLPNKGIIALKANVEFKQKVKEILNQM
jgi:uncharacterized protein (UPF0218 family)